MVVAFVETMAYLVPVEATRTVEMKMKTQAQEQAQKSEPCNAVEYIEALITDYMSINPKYSKNYGSLAIVALEQISQVLNLCELGLHANRFSVDENLRNETLGMLRQINGTKIKQEG